MAKEKSFVCVKDGVWAVKTPKPGMKDALKTRLESEGWTIKKSGVSIPSLSTLEKWSSNGVARTLMGQRIEPDGYGTDRCPSWLIYLWYI